MFGHRQKKSNPFNDQDVFFLGNIETVPENIINSKDKNTSSSPTPKKIPFVQEETL